MIVQRTAVGAFTAEFENEQELRDEHRANLSFGALRLQTDESVSLHAALLVTLRGPWGGEILAAGSELRILSKKSERHLTCFIAREGTHVFIAIAPCDSAVAPCVR